MFGASYFDYLTRNAGASVVFDQAMTGYTTQVLRQHYSVFRIAQRLLELLKPITVADDRRGDDDGNEYDDNDDAVDDHYEELMHLLR